MHLEKNIQIQNFSYTLPEDKIAKYPLEQRDGAKLLHYNSGEISNRVFTDIPDLLSADDLLVSNNTRVIHARLLFAKDTGAQIEVFCLEPIAPTEYVQMFSVKKQCVWKCFVKNAKKWKSGSVGLTLNINGEAIELKAEKLAKIEDAYEISLSWDNEVITMGEILEAAGKIPIPPYLMRDSETIDDDRYQTIYSKINGSVAAPTAGLHFTNEVIEACKENKIQFREITLHVGAGTFKPVKTDNVFDHTMHAEKFIVTRQLVFDLLCHKGKVVAVGTTTVRSLESIVVLGKKILNSSDFDINQPQEISQWEAYDDAYMEITTSEALQAVLNEMDGEGIAEFSLPTQIMIVPGFKFGIVDKLITNFHQPQSTLLLLVSAFTRGNWEKIYYHALNNNYRFLSYGDSSLLVP